MKFAFIIAAVFLFVIQSARAEDANLSNIKIEEPSSAPSSVKSYSGNSPDEIVSITAGAFSPASVQISNGAYNFNYGQNTSTVMGQAGWALKLFDFYGAFYFQENLGFSQLGGSAAGGSAPSSSYSLDLFGFDTRLMYSADWFPWKRLIPFVDGGFLYTVYYQPGASGLDSISGGVGNGVAGAGLRFWLNRDHSLQGAHPVFLSAKVNRIFNSANSVDLAATSVFGGVSFGL